MRPLVLALLAAGCSSAPPAPPAGLAPHLERSFLQSDLRLVLVGEDWALEAQFEERSFRWYDVDFPKSLPREYALVPSQAYFFRLGPGDGARFTPKAGPATPPDTRLSGARIDGLRMTLFVREVKREPEAAAEITLSSFVVDGRTFHPMGPMTLKLRGPYP